MRVISEDDEHHMAYTGKWGEEIELNDIRKNPIIT